MVFTFAAGLVLLLTAHAEDSNEPARTALELGCSADRLSFSDLQGRVQHLEVRPALLIGREEAAAAAGWAEGRPATSRFRPTPGGRHSWFCARLSAACS